MIRNRIWRTLFKWQSEYYETYEADMPWLVNTYFVDNWITRVLGWGAVHVTCAICGDKTFVEMKMPRIGYAVSKKMHPNRVANRDKHEHPDLAGNPLLWSLPLLNPVVTPR